MFERRSIWIGFFAGFNLILVIWHITVQEPIVANVSGQPPSLAATADKHHAHPRNIIDGWQGELYAGKHLLAEMAAAAAGLFNESAPSGEGPTAGTSTTTTVVEQRSTSRQRTGSSLGASRGGEQPAVDGDDDGARSIALSRVTDNNNNTTSTTMSVPPTVATTATLHPDASTTTASPTLKAAAGISSPHDFGRLIDLPDFHFRMRQPPCSRHTRALILVHSAPHNHGKRTLIRDTWGGHVLQPPTQANATHLVRLIFLLGSVREDALQQRLVAENRRHRDMVQGSFVDNYRNMTYKHVMAFKWFLYQCPQAELLLKVDDDVFVNTPQLLAYLHTPPPPPDDGDAVEDGPTMARRRVHSMLRHPRDMLFCQEYVGSVVKRSYRSKWRVSYREYAPHYYPPYCPGYAIVYSRDVVARLYAEAQRHPYFWIDDVHITGVLAQRANITITTSLPYLLFDDECERLLDGHKSLQQSSFLFAWHLITPQQIRDLWRLFELSATNRSSDELRAHVEEFNAYPHTSNTIKELS